MDISGNDGPSIKKTFTCKGCKWLSDSDNYYTKRSCLHPDIVSKYTETELIYKLFEGMLKFELDTPSFCPYLVKKIRLEKLKTIDGK